VVPGEVIVKFKSAPRTLASIQADPGHLHTLGALGLETMIDRSKLSSSLKSVSELDDLYRVQISGDQDPRVVASRFRKLPEVEFASPRIIHRLAVAPNDSLFELQGYLVQINAPQAWEHIKAEQNPVVIAIVDGGSDIEHPDISPNLWINPDEIPDNQRDDDGNGYVDDIVGWNFATETADPSGLSNQPGNASHGTHVAGLASAVSNNGIGISGVSWNARLMILNAAYPLEDNALAYGYEAMLYAVDQGAKIINCSWGSYTFSDYEQYIIDLITEQGAIVVAAAGNEGLSEPLYPASYRNVLSVAAVDERDRLTFFSNSGENIDITAPGLDLISTIPNQSFASKSGTSMATPLVSGTVALVSAQHPDWSGIQIAEQVRATALNIDELNNTDIPFLTGKGRLDALAAVTQQTPSVRLLSKRVQTDSDNQLPRPGININLYLTLINYLQPADNLTLELIPLDGYASVENNSKVLSLEQGEQKDLSSPFVIAIDPQTPPGHRERFLLKIQSTGYEDRAFFSLLLAPSFAELNINNIQTSITQNARIGFSDPGGQSGGTGFRYQSGSNLLFEGAWIAGTGPDQISSSARGDIINKDIVYEEDFSSQTFSVFIPGEKADQETHSVFRDINADSSMEIRVTQQTFGWKTQPFKDLLLFRYTIENTGSQTLVPFHFGLFFDWDIGQYSENVSAFDGDYNIGYVYDSSHDGSPTFIGLSLLGTESISYHSIVNNEQESTHWGIYDGFTDEEKWQSISGGITTLSTGPTDISHVMSAGPFSIAAGDSRQITFALIAGSSLSSLRDRVVSARQLLSKVTAVKPEKSMRPLTSSLRDNYPNPFNPTTTIPYTVDRQSRVRLEIVDITGARVRILVDEVQSAGDYSVQWNATDSGNRTVASGVYFYRLNIGNDTWMGKMTLLW
jgi:subtilisin family serine protease